MRNFKIVPLTKSYATKIQQTLKDDFDNNVTEQIATGFGPCRVSLKPFKVGQDVRLLFKHSPFEIDNIFNQVGPIFIHKDEVEEYQDVYHFPKEIKADKINFPLTLIGYSKEQKMIFTKLVGELDVENLIEETFNQNEEIDFLHVRNAEASCFICKIERV